MSKESAKMDLGHDEEPKRPKMDEQAGGDQPLQTQKAAIAKKTVKMMSVSSDASESEGSSSDEESSVTGEVAENGAAAKLLAKPQPPKMDADVPEQAEKMDEALEPAPEILGSQPINMPIIGEVKSLGSDDDAAILEALAAKEIADADTDPLEGAGDEQGPAKE